MISRAWDAVICLSLWSINLLLSLNLAMFGWEKISDPALEYATYMHYYATGRWQILNDNILSTSMTTTYFPALLARLFSHTDPEFVFNIYYGVSVSFIPALGYLLYRRYASRVWSLSLAVVLLTNWYVAVNSVNVTRFLFTVALAVVTAYICSFGLKSKKAMVGVVLASTLVIVSHYTVVYFMMITSIIAMVLYLGDSLIRKRRIIIRKAHAVMVAAIWGVFGIYYYLYPYLTKLGTIPNATRVEGGGFNTTGSYANNVIVAAIESPIQPDTYITTTGAWSPIIFWSLSGIALLIYLYARHHGRPLLYILAAMEIIVGGTYFNPYLCGAIGLARVFTMMLPFLLLAAAITLNDLFQKSEDYHYGAIPFTWLLGAIMLYH